jgi:hypothetical protein
MLDRNNGIPDFLTLQYTSEIIVESINESRSLQGSYAEILGLIGSGDNLTISDSSLIKLNSSTIEITPILPFKVRN